MKELVELKQAISDLDAPSLISDKMPEILLEKACVNFLKAKGYKVVEQVTTYKANNIDELITLFYRTLEYYDGEVCTLVSNKKKDRSLLSNFIKQRQAELNCSHEEGLNDCANIVYGLFTFRENLGLTIPLGMWVFGGGKCKWITDRVINLLNSAGDINNELAMTKMADEDERRSEDEYLGLDFERLRRIHG